MKSTCHRLIATGLALFFIALHACASSPAPPRAKHAMVVSANRLASEVGVKIMKAGGNAVDASVAVGFALAVVFPEAGNIGGGGFMVLRMKNGASTTIDFREKAPERASRTMYLDSAGNPTDRSVNGHLSVGVPGTVAGFAKALKEFGTMKLRDVLRPAVELATRGFVVDSRLAGNLQSYSEELKAYPATTGIFFRGGKPLREGDSLRQPELANTLERIRKSGPDEFYQGQTARLIVAEMERGHGLISADDLKHYQAAERKPVEGTYRGYDLIAMAPPSSGGICLLELLNIIEGYDIASMGYHSSRSVHVMAEAMKRVFADRNEFLGDPDFVANPVERLISKDYAARLRAGIDPLKATPSNLIRHDSTGHDEGRNTTNYVVADQYGNIVSTTYTLNDAFGSKVIVTGAGFFLNDEMDDFSVKPGVPNLYGLIGGDANAILPGKRPLSSISSTIVLKDGKPIMALGARGGSMIITSVFQTLVNVIDFGMNIQEAVDAPRFHHQWLPDTLSFEKFCLPADVLDNLRQNGYALKQLDMPVGEVEALMIDPVGGWIYGGPDPHEGGVAAGY